MFVRPPNTMVPGASRFIPGAALAMPRTVSAVRSPTASSIIAAPLASPSPAVSDLAVRLGRGFQAGHIMPWRPGTCRSRAVAAYGTGRVRAAVAPATGSRRETKRPHTQTVTSQSFTPARIADALRTLLPSNRAGPRRVRAARAPKGGGGLRLCPTPQGESRGAGNDENH